MDGTKAAVVFLALSGCVVVDAPEAFEELAVFGFTEFDRTEARPREAVTGLVELAPTLEEELVEGYRVGELGLEELERAGVVGATLEAEIVGMSAMVDMTSDVDEFAFAWTFPDMTEVLENTIEFELGEETGTRDCFLSHECETYAYEATRTNDMGILGRSSQSFRREYRWLTLDDESVVLTFRDLVPTEADTTSAVFRVYQQYSYGIVFPTDAGTRRLETFWVDAEVIGADLPDAFALTTAVNQMGRTAEMVDEFVAENAD
jgi:hypothetical protein